MPERNYSTNMAAPYVTAVRTALSGVRLLTCRSPTPALRQCVRSLHVSPAASLCSSRTEPHRSTQPHTSTSTQPHTSTSTQPHTQPGEKRAGEEEEEEEEDEGPEYIPQRKAKNPMMKIGYAWMIGLPTGIIGFILAKREVDKNRLKQLKIRQRMKNSNEGDYEGSRYRHHPEEDVKLGR
ncbi:DUF4748 domain-containing protein isoform X2 [Labrus mixtus]|uniref:DUF4748 domain-containing protein isoform X2 n=1 Tax=Labrus mixtus TaxID=508554 RepID=UPI0029C0E548|nr:DUF4748 domain-containing protein isoform X2 [Labrus mixtus]